MKTKREVLRDIRAIQKRIRQDFLELGEALGALHRLCPNSAEFRRHLVRLQIGYRKALYLIGIVEKSNDLKLDRRRLRELGWTKVSILLPVLNEENKHGWIDFAETANAASIQDAVAARANDNRKLRSVVFRLPPEAADLLDEGLLRCGGRRKGRTVVNREKALMLMVARAIGAIPVMEEAA